MVEKKQTSKKVFDITNPKKVTPSSTSRPLIVTNRPIIDRDPMVSGAETKPVEPTAPDLPPSHTSRSIKPLDGTDELPDKPVEQSDVQADTNAEEPKEPMPAVASEEAEASIPKDEDEPVEADKPGDDEPAEPEANPEPKASEDPVVEPLDDETSEPADDIKDPPGTDAEEAKAQEAARQRATEMQRLIDSRQYFVPVNAVERKRSTRMSIFLTIVIIILAAILIDLMLDSQIVLLAEKIPHTHFFSG